MITVRDITGASLELVLKLHDIGELVTIEVKVMVLENNTIRDFL